MKIIAKKTLKETNAATCDFCQEKVDYAVVGSCKFTYQQAAFSGSKWVIDDWDFGFFGKRIVEGKMDFLPMFEPKETTKDVQSAICKDCILQLAKLIK